MSLPNRLFSPLRVAWYSLLGACTIITVNDNLFEVRFVRGPSMSPTLSPSFHDTGTRDVVLVSKWSPTKNLRRGDIVSFWAPHNPESESMKRIVALEGDTVITREDRGYPFRRVVVPFGHVWVEGDNWRMTRDSNEYGPISKSLITGKARYVILPWSRRRELPGKEFHSRTKVMPGIARLPAGWHN